MIALSTPFRSATRRPEPEKLRALLAKETDDFEQKEQTKWAKTRQVIQTSKWTQERNPPRTSAGVECWLQDLYQRNTQLYHWKPADSCCVNFQNINIVVVIWDGLYLKPENQVLSGIVKFQERLVFSDLDIFLSWLERLTTNRKQRMIPGKY